MVPVKDTNPLIKQSLLWGQTLCVCELKGTLLLKLQHSIERELYMFVSINHVVSY